MASKVLDEFMKLVGQSYLQRTLQGCIDEVFLLAIQLSEDGDWQIFLQIFDVRRQCEIDPSRLQETDNRDLNMVCLLLHSLLPVTLSSCYRPIYFFLWRKC